MDDKTLEDDSEKTIDVPVVERASSHYRREIGRRTALMGVGSMSLVGLLAACGDDESPGELDGTETPGSDSPAADSNDAPADDADASTEPEPEPEQETDDGATTDGPAALASTDEVPVGGGIILNGPGVVITRPTRSEFAAFSTTCTHQGCAVTEVSDGLIICPCHGSEYSVVDGSVQQGPAERPLDEVAIEVQGDQILPG